MGSPIIPGGAAADAARRGSIAAGSGTENPLVLACGGHDPTGGAGLQADIETLRARGARPLTLITATTAQNTARCTRIRAVDADEFLEAAGLLLAEFTPRAVKCGLLASGALAAALAQVLRQLDAAPFVLDPVLATGSGRDAADAALLRALRDCLLPRATLVTPNAPELRRLAEGAATERDAVAQLHAHGVPWVLVTGGHDPGPRIINRLHGPDGVIESSWPRLPGSFHGTGCTLASAITAELARGLDLPTAVATAEAWLHGVLRASSDEGRAQALPCRLASGTIIP